MPDTIKSAVHLLHAVASLKFEACAVVTRGIPSPRSKWQLLAKRPAVTHYGVCTSSPAKHHSPNLASKFKIKSTGHLKKQTPPHLIWSFYFDLFEYCLLDETCFEKASFFNSNASQESKKTTTIKQTNNHNIPQSINKCRKCTAGNSGILESYYPQLNSLQGLWSHLIPSFINLQFTYRMIMMQHPV